MLKLIFKNSFKQDVKVLQKRHYDMSLLNETIQSLAIWEELENPNFNRVQLEAVRNEAGLNRFVMTPQRRIEETNAIGIVSKAG